MRRQALPRRREPAGGCWGEYLTQLRDSEVKEYKARSITYQLLPITIPQETGLLDSGNPAQSLFVRQCFRPLFEILSNLESVSVLYGNSGVGKTIFISYFLHRLLSDRKRQVEANPDLLNKPEHIIVKSPDMSFHICFDTDLRCIEEVTQNKMDDLNLIWFITDSHPPFAAKTRHYLVLASPTRARDVRDWVKRNEKYGSIRYMPTWSLEEILTMFDVIYAGRLHSLQISDTDIIQRFALLGGNPRQILFKCPPEIERLKAMIKSSLNGLSCETLQQMANQFTLMDHGLSESFDGRYLHVLVSPKTFEQEGIAFASRFVCDLVWNFLEEVEKSRVISFIKAAAAREASTFKGQLFEMFGHGKFAEGRDVRLSGKVLCEEEKDAKLEFKVHSKVKFESLDRGVQEVKQMARAQVYAQPSALNYPAFDVSVSVHRWRFTPSSSQSSEKSNESFGHARS